MSGKLPGDNPQMNRKLDLLFVLCGDATASGFFLHKPAAGSTFIVQKFSCGLLLLWKWCNICSALHCQSLVCHVGDHATTALRGLLLCMRAYSQCKVCHGTVTTVLPTGPTAGCRHSMRAAALHPHFISLRFSLLRVPWPLLYIAMCVCVVFKTECAKAWRLAACYGGQYMH
jgi:hypothetical protein